MSEEKSEKPAPRKRGPRTKPAKEPKMRAVKETLPRGTPVQPNGQPLPGATISESAFQAGATLDVQTAKHRAVYEAYERIITNGGSLDKFDTMHGFALPFPDKYDICGRYLVGATVHLQRTSPVPEGERLYEPISNFPTYPELKSHLRRLWNGTEQRWDIAVQMGPQYPRCKGHERFEVSPLRRVEYERDQATALAAAQPAAGQSQHGTTGPANGINEMLLRAVLESRGVNVPASSTGGGINEQLLAAALSAGKGGLDASTVNLLVKLASAPKESPKPDATSDPLTMMLLQHFLDKDKRDAAASPANTGGLALPAGWTVEPHTGTIFMHGFPIGKIGQMPLPSAGETQTQFLDRLEQTKKEEARFKSILGVKTEDEKKDEMYQEVGNGWNIPIKDGDLDSDASFTKWALGNIDPAKKMAGEAFLELKKAYREYMNDQKGQAKSADPRIQVQIDQTNVRFRAAEAAEREAEAAAKVTAAENAKTEAMIRRAEATERLAKAAERAEAAGVDPDDEGDDEDEEPESERQGTPRAAEEEDDTGERRSANGAG